MLSSSLDSQPKLRVPAQLDLAEVMDPISDFISALWQLRDPDQSDYLAYELRQIVKPLEDVPALGAAVEEIFRFIEHHPRADLGSPGPLIHLLERFPGSYFSALAASLLRKPTMHTTWMVNRLLNARLKPKERQYWLEVLTTVFNHPEADEEVVIAAGNYLDYQKARPTP